MSHFLRILAITSDRSTATLISSLLEHEGHNVSGVKEPQQALTLMAPTHAYDAVVFDTSRQPPSNLYLLEALAKRAGADKLWLLAPLGMNSWKDDADRLGICNILRSPLTRHDIERMLATLSKSPTLREDPGRNESAPGVEPCHLEELPRGRYFLAACPAMRKIYSTLRLLAPVDVPVLLLGESGVGKDVAATLLHKYSLRSNENFVSVNCAALPSDLLESELFGYESGAFTGAGKAKPGKFEHANRGTILLDEIGEMSAAMQAKLLHVLQDGRFSRLGACSTTQVDVRVVAATNINMDDAITESTFREDLYYRLSAFTVTIPPVRERKEEIPFFVEEMLHRHAASYRQEPAYITPRLMSAMQEYDWPGNLRELSNFVIRILITHDQEAALSELTTRMRARQRSAGSPLMLVHSSGPSSSLPSNSQSGESMRSIVRNFKDQTESRLILETLDQVGWNRRHAAVQLRISYRALLYKIQQYGLKQNRASLQYHSG